MTAEGGGKPSIVDLLTHYGASFVPEGSRWRPMKCPFHEDRTASASVNTDRESFKCFACAVRGDAYDIVIWKGDARDFLGAIEFLERILGDSFTRVLQDQPTGKHRRGVFDEHSKPVAGQRQIVSSRVRRRPFGGT